MGYELKATYRGTKIYRTDITTDTALGVRNLFDLEGAVTKDAARGPWLTSLTAAKEYIREQLAFAAISNNA